MPWGYNKRCSRCGISCRNLGLLLCQAFSYLVRAWLSKCLNTFTKVYQVYRYYFGICSELTELVVRPCFCWRSTCSLYEFHVFSVMISGGYNDVETKNHFIAKTLMFPMASGLNHFKYVFSKHLSSLGLFQLSFSPFRYFGLCVLFFRLTAGVYYALYGVNASFSFFYCLKASCGNLKIWK